MRRRQAIPLLTRLSRQKPITLFPNQVENYEESKRILLESPIGILMNNSKPGKGKSYVIAKLSQDPEFVDEATGEYMPIGVIGPLDVVNKWRRELIEPYGLNSAFEINYESLRSMRDRQPKHGLLDRIDKVTENGKKSVTFAPTTALDDLLKKGMLVIIDEFQHIKNKSQTREACRIIVRRCLELGTSRVIFISGSPYDKWEHVINFLQLVNFIRNPTLAVYHRERNRLDLRGAQELINVCKLYDSETTEHILQTCEYTHKTVGEKLCFQLYVDVIRPQIVSSMSSTESGNLDVKNGHFIMSEQNMAAVLGVINELAAATAYDPVKQTINSKRTNYTTINATLTKSENAKLDTFERLVRETLMKHGVAEDGDPTMPKVVVMLNYTAHIEEMAERLADLNPLILNGQIKPGRRSEIIRVFQEPSDRCRVLICNPLVCAEGIDLDDKDGHWPRYCFMSPNYRVTLIFQAASRFDRADTKSRGTVRIVYAKGGGHEQSILTALARKTEILNKTLPQQVEDGVVFPGDYDDETEGLVGKAPIVTPPRGQGVRNITEEEAKLIRPKRTIITPAPLAVQA